MKRRSVETFSPRSKRQKSYSESPSKPLKAGMSRSPLRPLSVMELEGTGAATPSAMRGIAAGLSPAVKYADRTRKFKLDDLQVDVPQEVSMTTRQSARLAATATAAKKQRSSDENDDDIVVRLRAKLDARKKRREVERAELEALSSSNSNKSDLSGLSEGSNTDDDAELRAAKTASAKRRAILNRKSKFRMSVVKKVAETRQAGNGNASPGVIAEENTDEEEETKPKPEKKKSPSVILASSRRSRPISSSSSQSDGDRELRRSKRTGRPSSKRQARDPVTSERSTLDTPKSSKTSEDTTAKTPVELQMVQGEEVKREATINRTVSVKELKGSGLVSSVKRGFEKKPSATKSSASVKADTPQRRPLSKLHRQEEVEAGTKKKSVQGEKRKKGLSESEGSSGEEKPFRSEVTISIGSATRVTKSQTETSGKFKHQSPEVKTEKEVFKSDETESLVTEAAHGPSKMSQGKVIEKFKPVSPESKTIPQRLFKMKDDATTIDKPLDSKPSKDELSPYWAVQSDSRRIKSAENVTNVTPVSVEKQEDSGTPEGRTDFPEGTPRVKDMLKVWRTANSASKVHSGKGKKPEKLRRQSLENTPDIKEMMKKFHDSVHSSGGRRLVEDDTELREEALSTKAKPEHYISDVIPEEEETITPEDVAPKSSALSDTPLSRQEYHSPTKLSTRWQHMDKGLTTSASTPVSTIKSSLHDPESGRHVHHGKVSFSPFVKTRTICLDVEGGLSEQNVSISSASVSGESVCDESFDRMVDMNQRILENLENNDEVEAMEHDQDDRYHTQPVEGADDDVQPSSVEVRRAGMQRHHTQPITSSEKESAETLDGGPVKEGIASRVELSPSEELALLQKRGEEDWKKRVGKKESPVDEVKMRAKSGDKKERPTSIADRLSLLKDSKESWRDRIEESDARQFTVAGKMELTGKAITPDSPLLARKRKPKVPLARESESSEGGSTPSSPTKPGPLLLGSTPQNTTTTTTATTTPKENDETGSIRKSVSDDPIRALSTPIMSIPSSDDEKDTKSDNGPIKVDVPNVNDETITEFFQSRTVEELSQEKVDVSVDDFNHIFMEAQDILSSVQKAKPQMRRATASRNPLKTLAQRRDIQSEYIEIRTDIADREMKRIKREQIAGSACYATEALAGLAAKENFAQVMLRKTDSFTSGTPGSQSLDPFKDVMLLQVKGRRHCQIRLVSPEALSLNSGDCFILVTTERCWVWIGEYCNVIERAKAVEVAGIIQQKRDLGCKSPYEPTVMEERAAVPSAATKKFWELLGGYGVYQDVGPAEEDEVYEADMAETTRVYRLAGEEFNLWEEVSGCVPRYEMLTSKDILLFDFGSEMYLWTGKQAAFPKRKVALKLARDMWAKGYDYTTHGFNPMCPLIGESQGGLPLSDVERPGWGLFGKVNQNMETILFREKFFDWPDSSRLIAVKAPDDIEAKADGTVELTPADVSKMLDVDMSPVSLVLEGSHVGRGNTWTEMYEGLKREYEITTLATKVWHVNEFQVMDIDEASYGQFHVGDTYVVRWQYMIMQTGMKTLKGADARHSLVGRERCAYFFWQGRHSSVNEKGASALMTVELDEERGPQVRVVQDKEPPCFLNLFKSKMVVHIGKRENAETCTKGPYRLYIIRNELKGEAHLTEVKCEIASLRSRGSFVLINVENGKMLLWNGSKAGMNTKQRALEIAQNLKTSCPLEMGITPGVKLVMTKMDEGCETADFWRAIGSTDTSLYVSMLDDVRGWSHMPRLFHLTSVSGEFKALEIINPCRSPNICTSFPFIQTDMYTAQQPALFMLDNLHEVYLWQGWWPEAKEDTDNVNTGSAVARFITDRKCALQTVLNYCQAKNPMTPIPSFVVYGGLEPKMFTNLFPYWERDEEATSSNIKEGKTQNERTPCRAMLHKLTSSRYTFEQLQERPLPDGVDPLRLEDFLTDTEFERVLGMSREEFQERPRWKQDEMKKDHSLF